MEKIGFKLNLGCGKSRIEGFLGVDNNPNAKYVDIIYDLNKIPYPFKDNSIEQIIINHVLEHLNDPIRVIIELNRISDNDSIIHIRSPHFSCNWLHPGHKSVISSMLFNFFDHNNDDHYGNCSFIVLRKKLHWLRAGSRHSILIIYISKTIDFFANLYIGFCERIWCYWVGGFEEIEFDVKVVKKNPDKI